MMDPTQQPKFWAAIIGLLFISACSPAAPAERVRLTQTDHRVEITLDDQAFTTYHFGPESPKPYLHPLRAAGGVIVTRGFPMRTDIPGESQDHPHHRALYFAHGDINGIDFWAEGQPAGRKVESAGGKQYVEEGMPRGRTAFQKLLTLTSGAESGQVSALFHLLSPQGDVIAEQTQKFIFHADETLRVVDCEFQITAASGPVKLGDTKEGTFAIRVVDELRESNGAQMVSSAGGRGETQIWGKQAHWVDYSGNVGSEALGVAIFDHPGNVKHPTYWHARGYGLFAANPFGEHHFYDDPARDGSVSLAQGESLTLRYRVIIHPGNAEQAGIAQLYKDYQELAP